jgi:hypothetical protein
MLISETSVWFGFVSKVPEMPRTDKLFDMVSLYILEHIYECERNTTIIVHQSGVRRSTTTVLYDSL